MHRAAFLVVTLTFALALSTSAPSHAQAPPAPAPETPTTTTAPPATPPAPATAPATDAAAPATAAPPAPAPAAPAAPAATTPPPTTAPAITEAPKKAEAPGKLKVIVLDLKAASLSPAEASAMSSLVTVSLSEFSALEVVSGADVREMLELEGQKATLGCEENVSCLAEIAGALGARIVAYGQIEKLGSRYLMSFNLQDTKAGKSAGRMALQGDGLDSLAEAVPGAVQKMTATFLESEHLSTASTSARATAPKLVTAPVAPPPDHGGLLWTSGIAAGTGLVVLALSWAGGLAVASSSGAPGDIVSQLKVPVAGKFQVASELSGSSNNGDTGGQQFALVCWALGGVETLASVAVVAGGAGFTAAEMLDGPKLGGAGNAWRFGLLGGGLALAGGGVAVDLMSPTSADRKLDAVDFVPPVMEILGVTAAIVGVVTNPFPAEQGSAE